MKDTRNSLLMMIIGVVAVIAIVVIGVSYAYTNSYSNSGNVIYNVTVEDKYKFITTGNTTVSATIDNISMFAGTTNKTVYDKSQTMTVKLEVSNAKTTTCTYDIVWVWESDSSTYTLTSGATNEYTVSGTWNGSSIAEKNVSSNLKIGSYSISSSSSATHTGTFNVKFYNLMNFDQSDHKNKTYKGSIKVNNVSCTQ